MPIDSGPEIEQDDVVLGALGEGQQQSLQGSRRERGQRARSCSSREHVETALLATGHHVGQGEAVIEQRPQIPVRNQPELDVDVRQSQVAVDQENTPPRLSERGRE